jgi:putative flippase GtrA
MMSSAPRVELRRVATFLVAGALNTLICYALFTALVHGAHWRYDLALAADYGLGVVLGYALQRCTTFADRTPTARTAPKYVAAYAVTFAVNLVVLHALVQWSRLDPLVAQAASLFVVTVASYTLQKRWVFSPLAVNRSAARTLAITGVLRRQSEVEMDLNV